MTIQSSFGARAAAIASERKLAQIERILHGIELKGLARQRAVGQTGDEWVAQYRGIDRFDRMPEFVGERARPSCVGSHPTLCQK
jgi:hypothetical protein